MNTTPTPPADRPPPWLVRVIQARDETAIARWAARGASERPIGLYTAIGVLALFLVVPFIVNELPQSFLESEEGEIVLAGSSLGVAVVALVALAALRVRPSAFGAVRPRRVDLRVTLWLALALGLFYVVVGIVMLIVTGMRVDELIASTSGTQLTFPLVWGLVIVPPIAEEFLFRGVTQTALRRDFGPVAAYFLSAAIFAIAHRAWNEALPIWATANHLLGGLVFGLAYEKTGALWPGMLLHFLGNGMLVVGVLLYQSGLLHQLPF